MTEIYNEDVLSDSQAEPLEAENNPLDDENESEFTTGLGSEPLEEETEHMGSETNLQEPEPLPWEGAPTDRLFYERLYDDGHLGSFTQSAELAYKMGWDIEHNYILIADTEQSEINGWTYRKEDCPHKTQEQLDQEAVQNRIVEIQNAVQNLLDSKAQEKLYDNGFAIASYATSTNETFRNEAQRFVAWRDNVWAKCYEILGQFQSGEIEMPTVDYVMSELPVLEWVDVEPEVS
jgi:hypothetical protein